MSLSVIDCLSEVGSINLTGMKFNHNLLCFETALRAVESPKDSVQILTFT